MEDYERRALAMLFFTNKTLYQAQTSNKYRLNNFTELNESSQQRMNDISIVSLDISLQKIRHEIYTRLSVSREYVDFLSNIGYINLYDCAEIIVEVGDIGRFKNRNCFISYAGLAPVAKHNNKVYKITKHNKYKHVASKKYDDIDYCENLKVALTRCTQKMINNDDNVYKQYYDKKFQEYHFKHPMYTKKRLHLMALKKSTIKFAKEVYSNFKEIKELEDYERLKYDNIDNIQNKR